MLLGIHSTACQAMPYARLQPLVEARPAVQVSTSSDHGLVAAGFKADGAEEAMVLIGCSNTPGNGEIDTTER